MKELNVTELEAVNGGASLREAGREVGRALRDVYDWIVS